MGDEIECVRVAMNITKRQGHRVIGAAVYRRLARNSMDDQVYFSIELFDFMDNEQFSNLDSFFIQVGKCVLYLSDDFEDTTKGDGKKVGNLLFGKEVETVFLKRSALQKKGSEISANVLRLCGNASHATNVAETERPLGYGCIGCLIITLRLLDNEEAIGKYELRLGSMDNFMRLDTAAAETVNLLPKPDHPSQYGSIFGVLNRCKTKMGSRLLERWLRQPLVDHVEISRRLDIVSVLKDSTMSRNQLTDEALKSIPDLDTVIVKMQKKNASLKEVWNVYLFTRALPKIISSLTDLQNSMSETRDTSSSSSSSLTEKFIVPFQALIDKFSLYQQLIEAVIDFDKLPDLIINPKHDLELQDLREDLIDLEAQADALLEEAKSGWGANAGVDVKLEQSSIHGFNFRSTKQDDDRQLTAANRSVRILSIQKNGVHFTTPKLESIANQHREISVIYKEKQSGLVSKTVETAVTYLPVVEAASTLVAELDTLAAFATTAALSPGSYVRPTVLPKGEGVINLKGARHPCVELMDSVEFIANDYDLFRDKSSYQIITGPNMGGKSTYIRGVGCIAVMAQVGSFVPCEEAELSIVDCILARVGAGDAVQKGVSTFMAEMLEASVLLETATKDSLIIIDELGRGTSTFDGFGIAWSISDYIIRKIGCSCLFATHFHELTAMSKQYDCVKNKHVSAITENGQVVMLYSISQGPCTQSFGIHVAATADFPCEVIVEAKRKAKELEQVGETHLGDASLEVDRAKRTRCQEVMKEFACSTIELTPPVQLKSQLQSLFPPFPIEDL